MQIFQLSDVTLAVANDHKTKNARVANTKNMISFGIFPLNNHGFPIGNIYLKLGFIGTHGSERRGAFGLRHVWEKHSSELGLTHPKQIPAFVESILQPGAEVIIDQSKSPNKPLIVESNVGLITLGVVRPNAEPPYFNIITAYGRRGHPGIVIASL